MVETPEVLGPQPLPPPFLEYTPEMTSLPVSVTVCLLLLLFVLYCFVLGRWCCRCCRNSNTDGSPIEGDDEQDDETFQGSQTKESSNSVEESYITLLRSKIKASQEEQKIVVIRLRQEQAITGFYRNLNQSSRQDRAQLHERILLLEEEQNLLSKQLEIKISRAAELTHDKEELREALRTKNKETGVLTDDEAKMESTIRRQKATI